MAVVTTSILGTHPQCAGMHLPAKRSVSLLLAALDGSRVLPRSSRRSDLWVHGPGWSWHCMHAAMSVSDFNLVHSWNLCVDATWDHICLAC
jgi:hypothetical protein